MKSQNKIALILMIFELFVVLVLIFNIFSSSNILGAQISITPISKDAINFPGTERLKYFYEPIALHDLEIPQPWDGKNTTYHINDDALNERLDYSLDKPKNVFRIITLGDSYTFGLFVKAQDNYPEQLEIELNKTEVCKTDKKIEVINLGVFGYDIEYSVERFKRRGQKYNPDLILWFIKGDDVNQIMEIMSPDIEQARKNGNYNVKSDGRNSYYKENEIASQKMIANLGMEGLVDYQRQAIKRISALFQGDIMVFAYNEQSSLVEQIVKDFSEKRPRTYYYSHVTNIRKANGLHFPDGHPNEQGYRVMTEELIESLKNTKLIPCN